MQSISHLFISSSIHVRLSFALLSIYSFLFSFTLLFIDLISLYCFYSRRKRIYTIDSDGEDFSSSTSQHKSKEKVQVPKNTPNMTNESKIQVTSDSNDSLAHDFKEIAATPLVVESSSPQELSSGDEMKNLMALPEDEQIEWAMKESMKTSSNVQTSEGLEGMDIDYDMDCTDEEIMTALSDHDSDQTIGLKYGAKNNVELITKNTGSQQSSDSELSLQSDDSRQVIGLKGGASSDTEQTTQSDDSEGSGTLLSYENVHQRTASYKDNIPTDSDQALQSDQSEISGLTSSPKGKLSTVTCIDSSDTSVDEDGVPKPKKDNSLCAIIDQHPVLNEFVDDLLIAVDNKKGTAKMLSTSPTKDKFVKSCVSSFNAKYHPAISKSQSATKAVRTPSPVTTYSTNRYQQLSKTTQPPKARKSLYTNVKNTVHSNYDDDLSIAIQKSLEDQVSLLVR